MTLFRPVTHTGWKESKRLQHRGEVVEVPEARRNREGLDTKAADWAFDHLGKVLFRSFVFCVKALWNILYEMVSVPVDAFFDWVDRKICERAQKIEAKNKQR